MPGIDYTLGMNTSGFTGGLQNAFSRLAGMQSQVGGLGNSFSALGAIATPLGIATAAVSAFAAAIGASLAVLQSYAEYDGLVRGLKTIEGTAAATTERIAALKQVAKAPGLGFEEAVRGDIKLRSVGISADLSARAMKAFGNALATVGGGKAELNGVLTALTQIQSKGKISAEEIMQIAERVPQVRAAMTAAFGTADTEKLSKGVLTTTQFIEGLVNELGKLPQVTSGAQNTLDNYSDSWKELKTSANEFFVGMAGSLIDDVSRVMHQLSKDLEKLKKAFGMKTPGLQGPDGTTDAQKQAEAAAAAKEKAAADDAAMWRDLEDSNAAYARSKDEERFAGEKVLAEKRAKLEEDGAKRTWAAQERVYAARLTEEADIQRKMERLQSQGPLTAEAVNATPTMRGKADISERIAEYTELEQKLKGIREGKEKKPEPTTARQPTADRLRQIGGYVGGGLSASRDRIAERTEQWTRKTAEAVTKLAARTTNPASPQPATF